MVYERGEPVARGLKVELRSSPGGQESCPFCQDEIAATERVECESCRACYHRECALEWTDACAVLGCTGQILLPGRKRKNPQVRDSTLVQRKGSWAEAFMFFGTVSFGFCLLALFYSRPLSWLLACLTWSTMGTALLGYAWQNFLQAMALDLMGLQIGPGELAPQQFLNKVVSVQGLPVPAHPMNGPYEDNLLWYRSVHEQFVPRGKQSYWETIEDEEHCVPFSIGGVLISNQPTEVHGIEERSFGDGEIKRERFSFLRANQVITVCGQLQAGRSGPVIVADESAGLLFTPTQGKTQRGELLKAILQFAVAIGSGVAIGLLY